MPVINRSALVMFSDQQMYDLVNDVSAYPSFIDGCAGVDILEQSPEHMVARLHLRKSGLSYQLVTRNRLTQPSSIELQLEDGPLQYLTGQWQFTPLKEDACKVVMQLDFAMAGVAGKALGGLLAQVAAGMVDAFCQRAKEVYA